MRQEFQFLLRAVRETPANELPGLLGEIEEIRYTALARLTTTANFSSSGPDQLLSIAEAACRLNVSQDYLYRHGKELPFTRRMGRRLLFSSSGIDRHIRQQDGLTAKRRKGNLAEI
jgi:excisionase family DNA binding protein